MDSNRAWAGAFALLALVALFPSGVTHAQAATAAAPTAAAGPSDTLSRFFQWWNATFLVPGGYTAEGFSRWFTPDATLVIDGREIIRGVDGWASHFTRIQSGGGQVEIVVPFKQVFQAGDRIYTYHVIRSRRDGKASCMLAAGHAELRGDRIASIVLVRAALDPAKGPLDPQCWTD
ncbi:MAG: hypothetical protein O9284_04580 [Steroidobacteraceae bacterium]|nr:hypothetical protein [Steroidobacteraceae bacterium]